MASTRNGLTLKGLAQILRDHMDATAAQFAEVGTRMDTLTSRVDAVTARIDDLRGEIGIVASIVRDLTQIVARHDDQIEEHRQYIRQVFSRMEQHDARFEAMDRHIRRILDAMEHRGGDGGGRHQQAA